MATTALLHRGLKVWFDSQPWSDDYSGPYADIAPDGTPFPYFVIGTPAAFRFTRTTESEIWRCPVVLSIYDTTKELCESHLDIVDGERDGLGVAKIVLPRGRVLQLQRMSELFLEEDEGVNKVVATYDAEIIKDRQR